MLSVEELGRALQGCAHSKDGLPMEVHDRLWPQLGTPLRAILREVLQDTDDPAPLAEFLTGVITLVPKAGEPRDQVAGYRPITPLNCDVRLVARALEDRLQLPLDLLVSSSQSAFILGRDISDSVQFHLSLLEYLLQRGSLAWLLLLDLSGAYDNVSWGMLHDTMEAMGFRKDGHVRWAQLLHRGASSQVLVNGRLTDSFPLASGLHQGSGASPLYWCIALQPLVSYLSSLQLAGRINTPTIPHSPLTMCQPSLLPVLPSKEYADDLTIAVLDRVRDGAV
ncbi:MAG: reverse transcriptase domain-containing protein, partial [Hydrogenophaga sp.]|uniref:reverse transcriptase domain-containing protein n=1 Tax=Hydrogenophaga sp. TaxID=1904254 RepID=UPI0040354C8F